MSSNQNQVEQTERQRQPRQPGQRSVYDARKGQNVIRYFCKECSNVRSRQKTYKNKKSWANHYRQKHVNQGYVQAINPIEEMEVFPDNNQNQRSINQQEQNIEDQQQHLEDISASLNQQPRINSPIAQQTQQVFHQAQSNIQHINQQHNQTQEDTLNVEFGIPQETVSRNLQHMQQGDFEEAFQGHHSIELSQEQTQIQDTNMEEVEQLPNSQVNSTQDTSTDQNTQDDRPYFFRYTSKTTYQKRLLEPLCPGSDVTSAQYAYQIMEWKLQHNVSNEATNKLLRVLSTNILPQPNNAIHSYKQLKGIIGSVDDQLYERHCCPHNCCTFPTNLDKKDWHKHLDEKCPYCPPGQGYRFIQYENGNIKPSKRFFYYGLSKQIMMQISQPDFQRQYDMFKELHNDPSKQHVKDSYFRSLEYTRMKEATNGEIDRDESLIYDIGYDDLPLGDNFKAGLVFARPFKLPVNARYKQSFVIPLMFIPMPGKQQNEDDRPNMDMYFQELTDELYKLATSGINDKNGKTYKIFIGGIYADWLARSKMFKLMFPSAYRACGWCCIVGEQNLVMDRNGRLRPSGMYFLGYNNDTTFRKIILDQNGDIIHTEDIQRKVGQDSQNTKINEDKLMQIMKSIQGMPWNNAKQQWIQKTGVKGLPVILDRVWYLKYNHSILLPLGHTILLGLTKQILNMVFGRESTQCVINNMVTENEINKRHSMLQPTSECKRNTRPVATYYSSYIMEECLDFVTTFSCFVFSKRYVNSRQVDDILPQELRSIWIKFRKLVIFAFKPKRSAQLGYTIEDCQRWLHELAQELETIGGIKQCTPNLHQLCCRFFYQYIERGNPLQYLELWGERGNQGVRQATLYRMSKDPGIQYSQEHATQVSLQEFRVRYNCMTFDEIQPEYRRRKVEKITSKSDELANVHVNPNNEEVDKNVYEGYFQGHGHLMTDNSQYKEHIQEALFRRDGTNLNIRVLDTLTQDQCQIANDMIQKKDDYEIILYKQCKIDESVVINTQDYKLSNRQNMWFLSVFYQGRGTSRISVQKICKALQFVMIRKKLSCFSNNQNLENQTADRIFNLQEYKKQLPLRGILCQEYTVNNLDESLHCLGSPQDSLLEQSILQVKPVFIPINRIQYKCARYQDKYLCRSFFIYIDKEYDNNLGQQDIEDDEDEYLLNQLALQQLDN